MDSSPFELCDSNAIDDEELLSPEERVRMLMSKDVTALLETSTVAIQKPSTYKERIVHSDDDFTEERETEYTSFVQLAEIPAKDDTEPEDEAHTQPPDMTDGDTEEPSSNGNAPEAYYISKSFFLEKFKAAGKKSKSMLMSETILRSSPSKMKVKLNPNELLEEDTDLSIVLPQKSKLLYKLQETTGTNPRTSRKQLLNTLLQKNRKQLAGDTVDQKKTESRIKAKEESKKNVKEMVDSLLEAERQHAAKVYEMEQQRNGDKQEKDILDDGDESDGVAYDSSEDDVAYSGSEEENSPEESDNENDENDEDEENEELHDQAANDEQIVKEMNEIPENGEVTATTKAGTNAQEDVNEQDEQDEEAEEIIFKAPRKKHTQEGTPSTPKPATPLKASANTSTFGLTQMFDDDEDEDGDTQVNPESTQTILSMLRAQQNTSIQDSQSISPIKGSLTGLNVSLASKDSLTASFSTIVPDSQEEVLTQEFSRLQKNAEPNTESFMDGLQKLSPSHFSRTDTVIAEPLTPNANAGFRRLVRKPTADDTKSSQPEDRQADLDESPTQIKGILEKQKRKLQQMQSDFGSSLKEAKQMFEEEAEESEDEYAGLGGASDEEENVLDHETAKMIVEEEEILKDKDVRDVQALHLAKEQERDNEMTRRVLHDIHNHTLGRRRGRKGDGGLLDFEEEEDYFDDVKARRARIRERQKQRQMKALDEDAALAALKNNEKTRAFFECAFEDIASESRNISKLIMAEDDEGSSDDSEEDGTNRGTGERKKSDSGKSSRVQSQASKQESLRQQLSYLDEDVNHEPDDSISSPLSSPIRLKREILLPGQNNQGTTGEAAGFEEFEEDDDLNVWERFAPSFNMQARPYKQFRRNQLEDESSSPDRQYRAPEFRNRIAGRADEFERELVYEKVSYGSPTKMSKTSLFLAGSKRTSSLPSDKKGNAKGKSSGATDHRAKRRVVSTTLGKSLSMFGKFA
ncbi:hypothetical protein CANCADRAFT_136280 [Tortispora caseinolytica NRRL Y-17796]|uniref:DNA replication checkpoint mediator MRC1 domain-containing protein n=1 Tax=Tortispora caseinolytica NRRL Y-17796 TaxID=767744 RepID=A0A1E4TBX1_9ASCO|nr:hypothetical protein CANCADRAFT_136280 [Tortispora caseinolytica NRRL Y-17796]